MDLTEILAWALQSLGACGAIWGLYSKDTSKQDAASSKTTLTPRGRLAFAGVVLGLLAFGANQWREHGKSLQSEKNRIESERRAVLAENKLTDVQQSQGRIDASQKEQMSLLQKQTEAQATQIAFLKHLALVQQQLAGLELSWPATRAMQERIRRGMQMARSSRLAFSSKPESKPDDKDVYLETCLQSGDIVLARRPNYSWKLQCRVGRPQGILQLTFEIAPADWRAEIVDSFLDGLLSPRFTLQTGAGDEIVTFSTTTRPTIVERHDGAYKIVAHDPQTRLSTLEKAAIVIRMDVSEPMGLPQEVRFRSLDPLVEFDHSWKTGWTMKVTDVVLTYVDVGDEPQKTDIYSAFSRAQILPVSFEKLLRR